jgi:ubiquinone/menaquinone biosynthesis C-methylase UbiE
MTAFNAFEEPNKNTYVIDAENGAEMARLLDLDRITTESMRGIFPERSDLSAVVDVLDVGCGPGGWVHQVARTYPEMEVTGIDISHSMITYARAHAQVRQLSNAHFAVMDAAKPLDSLDQSFDLINARFLLGFMLPTVWPRFLRECLRIARPGGVIRLTEGEGFGITSSAAFEQLSEMSIRAMYRARRTYSPDERSIGITPMLGHFLRDIGCQRRGQMAHAIDYSAGTEAHRPTVQNFTVALQLMKPFLLTMGVTSSGEFERLYQQAEIETLANDFRGVMYFLTVWGETPAVT